MPLCPAPPLRETCPRFIRVRASFLPEAGSYAVVRMCPVPSARGTPAPALSAVVNLAAVHAHAFVWTRVFTPPGPIAGAEAPGPTAALSLAEDLPAWPLQQLHGVARPPAVHGRSGLSASGPVLVT